MFLRGLTGSTGEKGLVLLRLVAAPQEDFHVVCKGRVCRLFHTCLVGRVVFLMWSAWLCVEPSKEISHPEWNVQLGVETRLLV